MIDNTLHDLHQQAVKILSVLEATAVAIDQSDADPTNYTGALELAIDSMYNHIEGLDEAGCAQSAHHIRELEAAECAQREES